MRPHILNRAGEALELARHAVAEAEAAVERPQLHRCRARLRRTLVTGRPARAPSAP